MVAAEWKSFEQLDIRAGTVVRATPFPKAKRPAFQLWIDFGPLGIKKSSAQITAHYTPEVLVGKQVIAVVNFPPKQIADFKSECLVLGVYDLQQEVVLLQPDRPVQNGGKIG